MNNCKDSVCSLGRINTGKSSMSPNAAPPEQGWATIRCIVPFPSHASLGEKWSGVGVGGTKKGRHANDQLSSGLQTLVSIHTSNQDSNSPALDKGPSDLRQVLGNSLHLLQSRSVSIPKVEPKWLVSIMCFDCNIQVANSLGNCFQQLRP